jgi:hypothetical protein
MKKIIKMFIPYGLIKCRENILIKEEQQYIKKLEKENALIEKKREIRKYLLNQNKEKVNNYDNE